MKGIMLSRALYLLILISLFSCKKENETFITFKPFQGDFIEPTLDELKTFYDNGYTYVDGDMKIGPLGGVDNLDYLSNLDSVFGSVIINDIPLLTSINGLNKLKKVGGSLQVSNTKINYSNSLISLESIGGHLFLQNAEVLNQEDNSLGELKNVGGEFRISRNLYNGPNKMPALEFIGGSFSPSGTVYGLNHLKYIQGSLTLLSIIPKVHEGFRNLERVGELHIQNSDFLNLDFLNHLKRVDGKLEISYNERLVDYSGLDSLQFVGGDFLFIGNTGIITGEIFKSLIEIKGDFILASNKSTSSFSGFNSLISSKKISIYYNDFSGVFNALNSLSSVKGIISIRNNKYIEHIHCFNNASSISGDIDISDNNELMSIQCFENLELLDGNIIISENLNLLQIVKMEKLSSIYGYINVDHNYRLEGFNSLPELEFIGGEMAFFANYHLKSIGNFQNLELIGDNIEIYENYRLLNVEFSVLNKVNKNLLICDTDSVVSKIVFPLLVEVSGNFKLKRNECSTFEGFEQLTRVGGDFVITDYDNLYMTNGFGLLNRVEGDFGISRNSILNIDAFEYLSYVGGKLIISYNSELTDLCGITNLIINHGVEGDISIYDNAYNPSIPDFFVGNCSR